MGAIAMTPPQRRFLAAIALLGVGSFVILTGPATAQSFSTYHCRDGSEFVTSFYRDARRVAVKLDGQNITLRRGISATGSRYVKGDITVWIKGPSATLKRGRQTTDCSAG
jgi:membrane-bound inhibitor of C-type lysozyme